jgi:hypothetical protein
MCMDYRYPDKPTSISQNVAATLDPREWVVQAKYDGWRCLIHVDGKGEFLLFSSSRNLLTEKTNIPPNVLNSLAAKKLPPNSVWDAEYVGPRGNLSPAIYIFDCLAVNNKWIGGKPLIERLEYVRTLSWGQPPVYMASTVIPSENGITYCGQFTDFESFRCTDNPIIDYFNILKNSWFATGRGMHLCEGVVIKAIDGTLVLSPRSTQKSISQFKLKYREIKQEI